jgi:hypothetical protein
MSTSIAQVWRGPKHPVDANGKKWCTRCEQMKPVSEFRRERTRLALDGTPAIKASCAQCYCVRFAAKYHGSLTSRIYTLFNSVKGRAKDTGIAFTIDLDTLIIPDRCPVLDVPFVISAERQHPHAPSFDRINPKRGYVPGNVQIVCWLVNKIKSDCDDPEVFDKVAAYLRRAHSELALDNPAVSRTIPPRHN